MNRCPYCQSDNRDSARFCQNCGRPLPVAAPPVPPSASPAPSVAPSAAKAPAAAPSAPAPAAPLPQPPDIPEALSGTTPLVAAPANAPGEIAAAAATMPLPVAPPAFAALPVGALLDDGRYEVMAVINEGQGLNAYHVSDYGGRHCRQCGSRDNAPDERYCADCGAALPDGPVAYLLRETLDPELWEGEKLIIERKLWHKGLVNVYRIFEERPYGSAQRYYLVSDQDADGSLAALPKPQPEEQVLLWGQQLAQALAYLHREGIRHGGVRVENVRLMDQQAKLTNFGRTQKVRKVEGKDWPADEVMALARMLHDDLLAGQELSPPAAALFAKALSADKAVRYASAEAFVADLAKTLEELQRVQSVALMSGRFSHVGVVRNHNEDCLLTLEVQRSQLSEGHPVGLYVVADGMGGHEAGEVASGLAINAVGRVVAEKVMLPWIQEPKPVNYEEILKEACQEANRAVHDRRRVTRTDMGTTLVAALVVGTEAYVANIGDSRCYRINRRAIQQITADHSLVERLVATGQITREEARVHPQRNYIYRTVGDKPQVEVDTFKVSLQPGDHLVLCSDGLNSMIEDELIRQAVLESPHPQAACEQLVRLANAAGGDDNVTVIVVQALEAVGGK